MEENKILPFGELLKEYRKRRKITQRELAASIGVHRNTIGSWEHGNFLPDSKAIVLELAIQLHLSDQETQNLLEASITALSPYWYVPYQRNPFFTGRTRLLDYLHQHLYLERENTSSQIYAISGLGGIGKTQLALEYVYQHAHEYHAIFWIAAETRESILASFAVIAKVLQFSEHAEKEQLLVKAILHWLTMHKGWLLIFNNVEDIAIIKPFLPPARQGTVIITTRLHTTAGMAQMLELPPFSLEEGTSFLLHRADLFTPTSLLDQIPSHLVDAACALVETLGGLPLALDQAGAYIARNEYKLTEYLQLFQSQQIYLLNERPETADYPYSIAKTFQLSFEQINQSNAATADLLRMCAFLAPDAIPEELFTHGAIYLGPSLEPISKDPYLFNKALGDALRASLLVRQPQSKSFSLHRLVQSVLRYMLSETEHAMWIERIIIVLDALFPSTEQHTWRECERLLPHVLICTQFAQLREYKTLTFASLLTKVIQYLFVRGQLEEAEPLCQYALHIHEQILGPEHPDNTALLNKLANIYSMKGKYAEGRALYQKTLSIREKTLGPEHPDLAQPLYNMGNQCTSLGKFFEAEAYHLRALRILEPVLGPDHPFLAWPLSGLADVYTELGKYKEAEPLQQRAIRIREEVLGPDHLLVAWPLDNLAELYICQNELEKAMPLIQRSLSIREKAQGLEHPDVARALVNFAHIYEAQGKQNEALLLYQRVLHIVKDSFGHNRTLLVISMMGLATLYTKQGNFTEAKSFFQQALHIQEQMFGSEHPIVADILYEFAVWQLEQNNVHEAALFLQRAIAIREQTFGLDHTKTLQARAQHAAVLKIIEQQSARI